MNRISSSIFYQNVFRPEKLKEEWPPKFHRRTNKYIGVRKYFECKPVTSRQLCKTTFSLYNNDTKRSADKFCREGKSKNAQMD